VIRRKRDGILGGTPQSRKIKKGVIITTPRVKQSRAHSIAMEIMYF